MRKREIIEHLGQRALLLPSAIEEALLANDRLKALFSLLQAVPLKASGLDSGLFETAAHECGLPELSERLRDTVVLDGGRFRIPGLPDLLQMIVELLRKMIDPFRLAGWHDDATAFEQRLDLLGRDLPRDEETIADREFVDRITSIRKDRDSHHRLVMDMHRSLNELQRSVAAEPIEGASCYRLEPEDRARVRAFMRGLGTTSALRFDHPGLETTATRTGDGLLIQNDIGTSGAHVFVMRVRDHEVIIDYTDIHDQRADFFRRMLAGEEIDWTESGVDRLTAVAGAEGTFTMHRGRRRAQNDEDLDRFLGRVASRLTFLIDWNKARKRLKPFVSGEGARLVLDRAAAEDRGHRAFLELGGDRLVHQVIDLVIRPGHRDGRRLDAILGESSAVDFLAATMRISSRGLLEGRMKRLVVDELQAELLSRVQSLEQDLLDLARRQAAVIVDMADHARDVLATLDVRSADELRRSARRAARWERRADMLVHETREAVERGDEARTYAELAQRVDEAADGIEEALFLASLGADLEGRVPISSDLGELADLVFRAALELVKAEESAFHVHRRGVREDMQDMLDAIEALIAIEHDSDEHHRRVLATLVHKVDDARRFWLATEIARLLEESVDALAHGALILRDHIMEEVIQR